MHSTRDLGCDYLGPSLHKRLQARRAGDFVREAREDWEGVAAVCEGVAASGCEGGGVGKAINEEYRKAVEILLDLFLEKISMAIVIEDVETQKLVRELVALTGESEEVAILLAVIERLKRMQPRGKRKSVADEINAIALRCASLLHNERLRHLSDDEILGYDELGAPTN